jgi:hypothetical protein
MMKAHPYSFLTLIIAALAFLFSGQAVADDIDATLPDSNNTSSFQVKNSESTNNVLMKVQSGGNVAIGTTTPDEKLDVSGNVQISGTNGKLVFPSSHYDAKIELFKGGDEKIGTADNQLKLIAGSGTTDNIAFFGDSTEVMRVETGTTANVGIGTTDPKEKLQIGDRLTFHAQVDGSNSWRVISDNSYYNETSEADTRIVNGYASAIAFTITGDILFRTAGTGSAGDILDGGSYPTWNTPPLFVKNDGKIGIGTDTPNSTLQVNGSLALAYSQVSFASGQPTEYSVSDNDVIIGINPLGQNAKIILPSATSENAGRIITIKDETGGGGGTSYNIEIAPTGAQTIDQYSNASSGYLSSWGFVRVYSNGSNWRIIGGGLGQY